MKQLFSVLLLFISCSIFSQTSQQRPVFPLVKQDSSISPINPFDMIFYQGDKRYQMQVQMDGTIKMVPMEIYPPADTTTYFGEFYPNLTLTGPPILANHTDIDFTWPDRPIPIIPADNFSDRWTKTALFDSAVYTFSIQPDDGARLFIDDTLLINEWHGVTSLILRQADKLMTRGYHKIRLEHYDSGGPAALFFVYGKKQLNGK